MQDSVYHVLVEGGGRLGPFDRRTIIGMRVRKALRGGDVVVGADGRQRAVRDLVRQPRAEAAFQPERSGSYSVVQAIHAATLVDTAGSGCCVVPPFTGDLEVRVQTKVLRIEGRFREGPATRQDRLKIPLEHVVHAGRRGSIVDLGLRAEAAAATQRLTLDLRTPEAAGDFAGALPNVTAWPDEPVRAKPSASVPTQTVAWMGVAAVTALVSAVLVVVWVLTHR
ncbi:hypothetical protein HK414_17805 [Ramlibacter terrae]|uniref:Uncharacterized protein n=1 Tax=Ramlibacter terrae TaxID=2732511 RepID=A0ABX6P784_9BURK|nr:hypothetical protein HK414_17805 [Ramlibacter terrae]